MGAVTSESQSLLLELFTPDQVRANGTSAVRTAVSVSAHRYISDR